MLQKQCNLVNILWTSTVICNLYVRVNRSFSSCKKSKYLWSNKLNYQSTKLCSHESEQEQTELKVPNPSAVAISQVF